MSIFNRGHLVALIAAAAIAGCSSSSTDQNSGASTAASAASSAKASSDSASNLLSQRVVYFDFDKSAIRADAYESLQAHAKYLADHSGAKIRVEGHADERGTREYNMALGERRAKAVLSFLTANGASAAQLDVVSYGEEKPAATGHDEASWTQNRRAELVYTAVAP